MARESTEGGLPSSFRGSPMLAGCQVRPPSVDLMTPSSRLAKRVPSLSKSGKRTKALTQSGVKQPGLLLTDLSNL